MGTITDTKLRFDIVTEGKEALCESLRLIFGQYAMLAYHIDQEGFHVIHSDDNPGEPWQGGGIPLAVSGIATQWLDSLSETEKARLAELVQGTSRCEGFRIMAQGGYVGMIATITPAWV